MDMCVYAWIHPSFGEVCTPDRGWQLVRVRLTRYDLPILGVVIHIAKQFISHSRDNDGGGYHNVIVYQYDQVKTVAGSRKD